MFDDPYRLLRALEFCLFCVLFIVFCYETVFKEQFFSTAGRFRCAFGDGQDDEGKILSMNRIYGDAVMQNPLVQFKQNMAKNITKGVTVSHV